eukprot:SAG11_NODE_1136_length_5731_cov_23.656250_5_plen_64_part_00
MKTRIHFKSFFFLFSVSIFAIFSHIFPVLARESEWDIVTLFGMFICVYHILSTGKLTCVKQRN